ncbi:helix-turn-helix transcriptional regulator [Saccharibacillus alkalitolerans]|uniref:AraC family transcriptional regulator n=1 Tax=Saccharibacillus alkalitolerans TaxID=2705290 RepID=A0ABX0F2A0_9BACL|nr:AraC family transcriptional regulator [Saccharibacillus alkalitolerans]NGZ75111.1 AraC family transcriptional regulator [Saccharibacillus alkalitolerans]
MANNVYRFNEKSIDFAYRRRSVDNEHPETFHSHLGIELLLIHQGRGTLIVNNRSYRIEPGMLCVFQPYQLHRVRPDYSDGQSFERSLTVFEPTLFEAYFEKWPLLHAFFARLHRERLPDPCLYGIGDDHMLAHLFRDFRDRSLRMTEAERGEEISLFLINLFHAIKPMWNRSEGETSPSAARKLHRAEEILSWIETNYHLPYRLDDLAAALHLSPYHLSHLFKDAIGVSISEYISTRRIHEAVRLLATTDKPVSLIAEEIGLTNVSYFCKLFKENMNATPHQYRKRWMDRYFRL